MFNSCKIVEKLISIFNFSLIEWSILHHPWGKFIIFCSAFCFTADVRHISNLTGWELVIFKTQGVVSVLINSWLICSWDTFCKHLSKLWEPYGKQLSHWKKNTIKLKFKFSCWNPNTSHQTPRTGNLESEWSLVPYCNQKTDPFVNCVDDVKIRSIRQHQDT